MADTKISALASGGTIQDGDEFVIVRAAANFKASYATPAAGTVLSGYTTSGRTVDAAIMYNGSGYTVDRKVWAEDNAETWVVNGDYVEIDLPTEHDDIEIEINGLYWTGAASESIMMQISDDNKSTWETGIYGYGRHSMNGTGTATNGGGLTENISDIFAVTAVNGGDTQRNGIHGNLRCRRIGTGMTITGFLSCGIAQGTLRAQFDSGTAPTNIRISVGDAAAPQAGIDFQSKATMGDGAIKVLTK